MLLALTSAVLLAAILAVLAGLALASASSVAHDLYASVWRKGSASEASVIASAFAIAASAILPALILNLFWKRFNTAGVWVGMVGGEPVPIGDDEPRTGTGRRGRPNE